MRGVGKVVVFIDKHPRPGLRPIGIITGVSGDARGYCVYFAVDHATGFIKIGRGQPHRLLERMRELERDLGRPVTLLAHTPGTFAAEHALHVSFRPDQVRREWFRPSKRLDAVIRSATPAPEDISYWGEWLWFTPGIPARYGKARRDAAAPAGCAEGGKR